MSLVAKTIKPVLAKKFEDLLWAHTPSDWIVKGVFINNSLYVIIIFPHKNSYKIRRQFPLNILKSREKDLWGLAADIVQEMKSEIAKND